MLLTTLSMLSLTGLLPMWLLFEAGLLCGSLVKRRDEQESVDEADSETPANDQPPAAQQ
jgi:sec-independent protein translocase protein TatC